MKDEAIRIAKELLIKPFEGYAKRLPNGDCEAYPDPGTNGDPWTIGYGSTGPSIVKGTVWTHEQAEKALDDHIEYFYQGVIRLCPNLLKASPKRVAAIVSFAYNVGLGNLRISTLRKRILAEDWEDAQIEILKWNKAGGKVLNGLTRRRKAESIMLR